MQSKKDVSKITSVKMAKLAKTEKMCNKITKRYKITTEKTNFGREMIV